MVNPYRFLWARFTGWVRRSFSVVWLVLLAGYFLLLAGRAIYQNYQTRQQTASLSSQLVQSQQEEKRLQALVVYYQTDSFKQEELRRTLLLQMPGEKVYALPESGIIAQPGEVAPVSGDKAAADNRPLWRQWVSYVLHA